MKGRRGALARLLTPSARVVIRQKPGFGFNFY
jgi:hypothetical protein